MNWQVALFIYALGVATPLLGVAVAKIAASGNPAPSEPDDR